MRYKADLQRFDSFHSRIAEGDDRDAVIYAATQVYAALVPTILNRGNQAIRSRAEEEKLDHADTDTTWQDTLKNMPNHGLSSALSAEEWNITVYDHRPPTTRERRPKDPDVVFTIGATLEA